MTIIRTNVTKSNKQHLPQAELRGNMNIKLVSIAVLTGLISANANANIGPANPIHVSVIESKEALRQTSEEALRRYMDQRKKMQIESRLKAVENKLAVREQAFAVRAPM